MKIERGGRISQIDTSVLHVEWLGDERANPEVMSSSATGLKSSFFARKVALGYPMGTLLGLFFPIFRPFFEFSRKLITTAFVLPVQKTSSDEVFKPTVMCCSGVVSALFKKPFPPLSLF